MEKATTGERIKEYMKMNDMRQVDILNKCRPYMRRMNVDINKSMLSQYISGRCDPNKERILLLARAMNVSESWLAGYDVPMERGHDLQASERAAILADISEDTDLIDRIQKIQELSVPDKAKVYGYIDAVYELSVSDDDLDE